MPSSSGCFINRATTRLFGECFSCWAIFINWLQISESNGKIARKTPNRPASQLGLMGLARRHKPYPKGTLSQARWVVEALMIPNLLLFICFSMTGWTCGSGFSHRFILDFVCVSYLIPSNQEDAQQTQHGQDQLNIEIENAIPHKIQCKDC
jgi:hypothetical protein